MQDHDEDTQVQESQSRDCADCDGTGEGRHEGQSCPSCRGRGYFGPAEK